MSPYRRAASRNRDSEPSATPTAAETVLSRFGRIQETTAGGHPDRALAGLTTVICDFGGQPVWSTADEFARWMADEETELSLNPNR
ncbi:hypothetical protein [Streptosporangium sp. NPDC051022]|uniref:hypothetical protein n=1 Tax=Streptosporangium sp. NPDC051022 TaxID=3155752 RepID=UPI0034470B5D